MVLGKREGHTGQREANCDEEVARKTAAWRQHRMEGLSNEPQQNEERTKTATVDREAGHGTGLGSQPRRPHMAGATTGWGSRRKERGTRSPPMADQDADRDHPGGGWGGGSGKKPRRLGGQEAQSAGMKEEEHKEGNAEGAAGAKASGWGSAKETYAHDRLDPGGWTSSWTGWEPEVKEVEMDAGEKSDDTMDGTKKYVAGLPVGWGADLAEQTLRPRSPPGVGWGAGRGWGDSSPRGENTGGSQEAERVATPKPKEEDEEETQRACERINDMIEAEEKENQDEGAQWAEDRGFTIRDANNQFSGCFSAWNNGEQCGEFPETKCKRHKQGDGAFRVGSAFSTTADKTTGQVHKGDSKGSNAKKGELQSRDITRQLAEDTKEKEENQDEEGATVTAAGKMTELKGVNDESLRNEDKTEVILFKEGGFEPD